MTNLAICCLIISVVFGVCWLYYQHAYQMLDDERFLSCGIETNHYERSRHAMRCLSVSRCGFVVSLLVADVLFLVGAMQ